MELQLGLALPIYNPTKGFDLNNDGFEPKEMVGVEPWSYGGCLENENYVKNKRGFEESFEKSIDVSETLSLLLWSGQPNEEDDQKGQKKRTSCTINKNDKEENQVVGWPPVKSWRKKLLHQHQGGRTDNYRMRMAEKENGGGSISMYVKVKMEGVAIARKIDLRLYHSYQTLRNSLISMFAKYQNCDKDGELYTLTYQDKDGDWLLAGDVPWQTFIESVKRLEIVRNGS